MNSFLGQILQRPTQAPAAQVEIYTWQTCPYCIRAKLLLWWKRVPFIEYKIDGDGGARLRMAARSGGRKSVPQIFVNSQHLGGCDDLYRLDSAGQLDPLLAQPPAAGTAQLTP